jgi:hypothetical protein
VQWFIRRLVANQYLQFSIALFCFGIEMAASCSRKSILCFERKSVRSICVITVGQIECENYYCRPFEEAFYVSLRHSVCHPTGVGSKGQHFHSFSAKGYARLGIWDTSSKISVFKACSNNPVSFKHLYIPYASTRSPLQEFVTQT